MKNKRICFFNRSSVHYRQNIYNLLDRELGVEFFFGDSRPGNIKEAEVNLLKNFKGHLHNMIFGPFYWQRGVIRLLWSDYDYIITPGETYCISTWLLLLFHKFTKKKICLWTHGAYGNEKGFKKLLTIIRAKLSDKLFLYGDYAKNILIEYGINKEKLAVIYNSLAYDKQMLIRESLKHSDIYKEHFNNGNKNLIFIGRLTKVKKLNLILEAVARLKKVKEYYNVTFIGEGAEFDTLVNISNSLGIENNVWFYGACYDEKLISEFLYNADVCVSPGNVGLTAMHAMAFGCPVISHNNFPMQMPEFEAIEEGVTGAFFKENDIDDLVRTISSWGIIGENREKVRYACYNVIDAMYNPHVQIKTIKENLL